MDVVIGSGPSGVAAATALLARGRQVLMLDGGKGLEADRATARDRLAAQDPANWSATDRAAWQAPQFATPPGQIRRHGSDFAMEPAVATFAEGADAFLLRSSRAGGGLSNLWGSALLPYRASDMAGWPVSADDLAPHYLAVAGFLPVSGRRDDLQSLFPVPDMAGRAALPPSPQAERLLDRLGRAHDALAALGITAGQARQAVAPGCRLCGQCLHGCPWRLIWSAGAEVDKLRQNPNFTHRSGAIVTALREDANAVTLHLATGETLAAKRAFLGAGVLESARILLASGLATSLDLRDSAHGFLPFLHRWSAPRRPDRGAFHTLPQVFAELNAPDLSPFSLHAQLYTWNEFFEADLVQTYARRLPGSAPFFRALARRLIVAQIFLHSDQSATARLTLAADGRLKAAVLPNPATCPTFDAGARSFGRGLRAAGLTALTPARRLNPPGSSFHAGATLPMARNPESGQSDILGRPLGLRRLHLIDASSLPAIPATTITLSVMANAHRIGSLAP